MSLTTDIADALVASLNGGAFTQSFTAQRHYCPTFDLAEMDTLHVSVVPKSMAIQTAARDGSFHDLAVDIGVQKKVNEDPADIDALVNLMDEIIEHLKLRRLPGMPQAAWLSIEHDPIVAREHLEQLRQFTSVLTVTYRVKR